MSRLGWSLGLLAVVLGCGTTYELQSGPSDSWLTLPTPFNRTTSSGADQPSLDLSDEDVEVALAARRAVEAEREVALRASLPDADASLEEAVRAVRACYEGQSRDIAAELIAAHPRLMTWDESGDVVEISSAFMSHGAGGEIELTLSRREGVTGPLAVAFPPGTYGEAVAPASSGEAPSADRLEFAERDWTSPESEHRYRRWPRPQDLALLRAPVVVLGDEALVATVRVPVACASFRLGAPLHAQAYALGSFPQDTQIDALMQAICAGERPPAEAEVQLAVWFSREDLSWKQFQAEGGHLGRLATFGSARSVLPLHAAGAARLMLEAGVDPRPLRFFQEHPSEAPAIAPPLEEAPASEAVPARPTQSTGHEVNLS